MSQYTGEGWSISVSYTDEPYPKFTQADVMKVYAHVKKHGSKSIDDIFAELSLGDNSMATALDTLSNDKRFRLIEIPEHGQGIITLVTLVEYND